MFSIFTAMMGLVLSRTGAGEGAADGAALGVNRAPSGTPAARGCGASAVAVTGKGVPEVKTARAQQATRDVRSTIVGAGVGRVRTPAR